MSGAVARQSSAARQSTVTIPNGVEYLCHRMEQQSRPRPLRSVSEWADRYRVLTSKGSGEPGRWRTARTPYLREIMDCLSSASRVQRVVMMFAAQLGKTEVALNWIGYTVAHDPQPMLTVLPTLEVRKRWVRQRLDPLRRETPEIRQLIGELKSRDATNSEEGFEFPGGICFIGGANSAASLSSVPAEKIICDEVDRFPFEVGNEGDPLGLIDERTKTFQGRKMLLVSTPTVKGISRIETEYERSDMREYHVPCPECGHFQVLRWRRDDGSYGLVHSEATGAVRYCCEACGSLFDEHHKTAMLAAGRWIPRHPERSVRGYHLNGLYSPLGLGFSWGELWQRWQDAHGDTANLKRFINTTLGESWEEQGDSIDDLALVARLEDYPAATPWGLVTAGVDVQKDRLEVSLVGWRDGGGEEAWLIDHLILPGDTALPAVWSDLHQALHSAEVICAAIDAGYNTTLVYEFAARRRWAVPVKGAAGMHRPLVEDQRKRFQRQRRQRKSGIQVEPIGVDQAKALLYARLKLAEPGPGYIHFPNHPAFDDEYFAQLAAEKLVTKVRGTRRYQEWVQLRARNEALDCLVYATAAMRLVSVGAQDRDSARMKLDKTKKGDADGLSAVQEFLQMRKRKLRGDNS